MVFHFHRYAEYPDIACLRKYIARAEKLDVPLWMGETGENLNQWYTALYPLAHSLGTGYNLWTRKKMECTNSPFSVKAPKNYEKILCFIEGGEHPGERGKKSVLVEEYSNGKLAFWLCTCYYKKEKFFKC